MKLYKLLSVMSVGALTAFVTSCQNVDVEFPDYEGGISVYFAYQYPVRTIVLGEDTYDTTLDNEHKCEIYGTMGGSYKGKSIEVDLEVDNTLADNLYFDNGLPVRAMPSGYYSLAANKLVYGGNYMGGVKVQLTDAFFADPKALTNTYVIPLVMKKAKGADRILTGTPLIDGDAPVRTNSAYWNVQPKDYTLYCLKFINPWHANYLRRGIDKITEGGTTTNNVRHKESVEKDEVCKISTNGLKKAIFPVNTTVTVIGDDGNPTAKVLTCNLLLTFNDNNECTVSTDTEGCVATGSGKFIKNGEKKSWGNKDRNALYLDYNINFGTKQLATKDTLVVRDRGVAGEWFIPEYKAN